MIDYLVLPGGIMSHDKVQVPNEPEPLCMNIVIVKGVHNMHQSGGNFADTCTAYGGVPYSLALPYNAPWLGIAKIYEVKHMVLCDLQKYRKMMSYFHDRRCTTYPTIREHLGNVYDGIVDCEVVTLVMFTPGEGLVDGTRPTPEAEQSPEQV